jgi:large subunit ribosomal protein L25
MLILNAKIRKDFGEKVKNLRKKGILPAVLYGPRIKNFSLEINSKEFEKVFKNVGETGFISLKIEGKKRKYEVLIKEIQRDPLTQEPTHVDFYQPSLKEKITTLVPLSFVGESLAVKELKGTLVKNFSEVEIKSFPKNIPKEIEVDLSKLKTFEDKILVKDIKLPKGVEILRDKKDIVAFVSPPEKFEEVKKPKEEGEIKEEIQKKDEKIS